MKKIAFTVLVIVLYPLLVTAHPGHGETDGYSIIHYFVEPAHAVFTYGSLFCVIAYIWYTRQKQHKENV